MVWLFQCQFGESCQIEEVATDCRTGRGDFFLWFLTFFLPSIKTIIVSAKQRPSRPIWINSKGDMDSCKNHQGQVAGIIPVNMFFHWCSLPCECFLRFEPRDQGTLTPAGPGPHEMFLPQPNWKHCRTLPDTDQVWIYSIRRFYLSFTAPGNSTQCR